MCRFCLEGALVLALEEFGDEALFDALGPPIPALEEVGDLRTVFADLDSDRHALEVVMARLVEHYLLHGFEAGLFEAIEHAYGQAAVADYLQASRRAQPDSLGVALADITCYQQPAAWAALIANRADLVAQARARLSNYRDAWCTVWHWPADGDAAAFEPVGQPPSRKSCDEDADNLHARFVGDFAALAILARYQPDTDIIPALVAAYPMHQPGFSTLGLWLQRRALRHGVQHRGVGFLLDTLEKSKQAMEESREDSIMRNELFHYGVVTASLDQQGWQQLDAGYRAFIQSCGGLPFNDVNSPATQAVIERRVQA